MSELKLFDRIPLTEDQFEIVSDKLEQLEANTMMIEKLALANKNRAEDMWELVEQWHPETSEYRIRIDTKDKSIVIVGYDKAE